MKFKQLSKIVAVGSIGSSFCFLASCKESVEETTSQTEKPALTTPAAPASATPEQSAPTANKLPVYIVTVSGQG